MPDALDPTLAPLIGGWQLRSYVSSFSDTKAHMDQMALIAMKRKQWSNGPGWVDGIRDSFW